MLIFNFWLCLNFSFQRYTRINRKFYDLTKKKLWQISFIFRKSPCENRRLRHRCSNAWILCRRLRLSLQVKRSSLQWLRNRTHTFSQQTIFWGLGKGWSRKGPSRVNRVEAVRLQSSVHNFRHRSAFCLDETGLSSSIDLAFFLDFLFQLVGSPVSVHCFVSESRTHSL